MKRKSSPAEYYGVDRAPEFLQQVADHVAALIISKTTIDDVSAIELGQLAAERLAQVFGGCKVRIPVGTWNGRGAFCFAITKRDLAIYRMYNGRNWRDVCAAYRISRSTLFRIVREVHDRLHAMQTSISTTTQSGGRP